MYIECSRFFLFGKFIEFIEWQLFSIEWIEWLFFRVQSTHCFWGDSAQIFRIFGNRKLNPELNPDFDFFEKNSFFWKVFGKCRFWKMFGKKIKTKLEMF